MRRIALIPARGGSKSIPLKNIKMLCGKPLIYWALDAAVNSGCFERIYVSTDDFRIKNAVKDYDNEMVQIVNRSPHTATDDATTESVMIEFANQHAFDEICLIQPTSPLITPREIQEGINKFINLQADSLLSCIRQKRFYWKVDKLGFAKPLNYDPKKRPLRQDWNGTLVENGAFYITHKKGLLENKSRLYGKIAFYEMDEQSFVELDEPADWDFVESILLERNRKCWYATNKIKLVLTDVDGCLTDAGMYYGESGDETKKFNTRDGMGFELLKKHGYLVGIITSEDTNLVKRRGVKLKADLVRQGVKNKYDELKGILAEYGFRREEVAFLGDDLNDLEILKAVGFSACPADAHQKIQKIVKYQCIKKGGEGAFRELSDLIIGNYLDHST